MILVALSLLAMIWDLSMRGEDEGLTTCRFGRMIQAALWGIREIYLRKKHRGSHLNKRPKMNGLLLPLLCCDDRKGVWEISDFSLFKGLALFKLKTHQFWAFTGLTGFSFRPAECLRQLSVWHCQGLRSWISRKILLNKKNPVKQTLAKAGKQQGGSKLQAQIIPDVVITSSEPVMSLSTAVQRVLFANQCDIKCCQSWSGKTQHIQWEMWGDSQGSSSAVFYFMLYLLQIVPMRKEK